MKYYQSPGKREEQSGISSNVNGPEHSTAAMCVVVAQTKVRHSYINLDDDGLSIMLTARLHLIMPVVVDDDVFRPVDNNYAESVMKTAMVVNDNSIPPLGKDSITDKGDVNGVQLLESPSSPNHSFDQKEDNLDVVPTPSHPKWSNHSPSAISKADELQKVSQSGIPIPPGEQAVEQKTASI